MHTHKVYRYACTILSKERFDDPSDFAERVAATLPGNMHIETVEEPLVLDAKTVELDQWFDSESEENP